VAATNPKTAPEILPSLPLTERPRCWSSAYSLQCSTSKWWWCERPQGTQRSGLADLFIIHHTRLRPPTSSPRLYPHRHHQSSHFRALTHLHRRPEHTRCSNDFRRPHTKTIHRFPAICMHIHSILILDRSVIHAASARNDPSSVLDSLWYVVWHHDLLALTFLTWYLSPFVELSMCALHRRWVRCHRDVYT
jgi:hypothetical protein